MQIDYLKSLFENNKEKALFGRYITNNHIESLLKKFNNNFIVETIGYSVLKKSIYGIKLGTGRKRILMWSQMHGNESTTTKALFDLLNSFTHKETGLDYILKACTLYIIPILNPDGAEAYTRVNANEVDLNRDAQNLSQPESLVLRSIFDSFQPHYCYNLHGQRTIFSAGKNNKSAIVSFLSPAQDQACTVTPNRKVAMEIISVINRALQKVIPSQVGVYDDAFNINCVGDTFQSKNVPTILFEAGHFYDDYHREYTRELIYLSYVTSLDYIANNEVDGTHSEAYFDIPENEKLFLDVIIRNVSGYSNGLVDIGVQFKETLVNAHLEFIPVVEKIEKLNNIYAHREINAEGEKVLDENQKHLSIGNENVFVILKNKKIVLNPK
ncbi:M14 family zinc carboxypeptidase [Seonamhaeicola aphaedonensis]|uniref:Zinc carboxypeptidase n=1 Tax=Seonamhaeicola aphaedonensis TaxID=1461338 RepID=A0A3D9HJA5_9FLAO|nr:M14 family zinc carboxypeptidase [Seonamhaeicola aphaedonensis]RED49515.1 zinc carboxypeptidase [Seonamhaeicola aphaedonensis]